MARTTFLGDEVVVREQLVEAPEKQAADARVVQVRVDVEDLRFVDDIFDAGREIRVGKSRRHGHSAHGMGSIGSRWSRSRLQYVSDAGAVIIKSAATPHSRSLAGGAFQPRSGGRW